MIGFLVFWFWLLSMWRKVYSVSASLHPFGLYPLTHPTVESELKLPEFVSCYRSGYLSAYTDKNLHLVFASLYQSQYLLRKCFRWALVAEGNLGGLCSCLPSAQSVIVQQTAERQKMWSVNGPHWRTVNEGGYEQ